MLREREGILQELQRIISRIFILDEKLSEEINTMIEDLEDADVQAMM